MSVSKDVCADCTFFFLNYRIVYTSEKTSAKFHHQTGGEEIKSSAFVLTNNCFNHLLLRN